MEFRDIYSKPEDKPTVFEEIREAIQISTKPIDFTIQLIKEFHGGENVQPTDPSIRKNEITAEEMSIPMLRRFVQTSLCLNPAISHYFEKNEEDFPYFKPISEHIGFYLTDINMRLDESLFGPMEQYEPGHNSTSTNSTLNRQDYNKMYDKLAHQLNTCFDLFSGMRHLTMLHGNHFGFAESSTEEAHGYNHTHDSSYLQKLLKPQQKIREDINKEYEDRLRLIPIYFPEDMSVDNENDVEEAPNGLMRDYSNQAYFRKALDKEKILGNK
jgi:hypothetical protein